MLQIILQLIVFLALLAGEGKSETIVYQAAGSSPGGCADTYLCKSSGGALVNSLISDDGSIITQSGNVRASGYLVVGSTTVGADGGGGLHLFDGTPLAATAAASTSDTLVIEADHSNGMTILTPDASNANFVFGSPSDSVGASFSWNYSSGTMLLSTSKAAASMILRSGDGAAGITIDGSQLVAVEALKTTGTAATTGNGVVCVNTATGILYASTSEDVCAD